MNCKSTTARVNTASSYTRCTAQHATEQERIECVRARHRARLLTSEAAMRATVARAAASQRSIEELAPSPATLPREWREAFVATVAEDAAFRTSVAAWLDGGAQ